MKKNAQSLVLFVMAATLGGCASMQSQEPSTATAQPPAPQEKIVVGQGTVRGYEEYIACLEGQACNKPSDKYLPAAKSKPSNTGAALPVGTFHRVHFEWSKSAITASERARLASFAAHRVRSVKEIVIRGGTDPTGTEAFNFKLAQRRADAVKRELIRLGVPASHIKAVRHSPCCEQPPNSGPMTNQDLRRADIEIEIFTGTKK
jgi:outer membrane protein OmpA-like peptidoglycan-associated protein